MKLIDMVFIHATSRENSELCDVTTNVTDAVFSTNDVFPHSARRRVGC